jgi:hypothetical protein
MSANNDGLTEQEWPFLFVVCDTLQIPYPVRKKSSDLDELQGTPILLWGAQAPSSLPVVAPLPVVDRTCRLQNRRSNQRISKHFSHISYVILRSDVA